MRKCPNCKNPLPVGARRCVHCRALVGDTMNEHDNSSTHMGFGGSYTSEEERASSTSLGLPGSLTLSRNVDGGSRRQMNHGFDESPHHTMLGLGPVMSNSRNSYDSNNDTMGAFSGQRTISGMPGISGFSVNSMNRSSARTPERPLKAVSMRPTREVQTVSDADLMSMRQNTPAVSVAVPPSDALRSSPKLDAFTPSSTAKTPTSSDAVFDSMLQFSAASDANDDDPFAGLPGVAPKPSSLVDEEFVDLTSKLFGDDFAAGTSNVDDDEDGWDFDFAPSSPEPNVDVPKLNIPDPEPAKVEAQKLPLPKPPKRPKNPKKSIRPKKQVTKSSSPNSAPLSEPIKWLRPLQHPKKSRRRRAQWAISSSNVRLGRRYASICYGASFRSKTKTSFLQAILRLRAFYSRLSSPSVLSPILAIWHGLISRKAKCVRLFCWWPRYCSA